MEVRAVLPGDSEDLDSMLLKERTGPGFHSEVRVAYSALARKVGSHKEIVRLAIKRAEKSQSIREWRVLINPQAIGQKLGALQVDARLDMKEQERAVSQIKLIEGVTLIASYHGGPLRVVIYYESEESAGRKIQLIASICGVNEEDTTLVKVTPTFNGKLRRTDWMVVRSISKNPRRKSAEIASELGLSSRTVNRLIGKMTESRAIFLVAVIDVERSHGVSVSFLVKCNEEAKREVGKLVEGQRVSFATPATNEYYTTILFFKNVSEAEQFKGRLDSVHGVEKVQMYILRDHVFVDSWLDEVIQRNAA